VIVASSRLNPFIDESPRRDPRLNGDVAVNVAPLEPARTRIALHRHTIPLALQAEGKYACALSS
jgi:hypothetical protein